MEEVKGQLGRKTTDESAPGRGSWRMRWLVVAAVAAVGVSATALSAVMGNGRNGGGRVAAGAIDLASAPSLLFRNTSLDGGFGRVAAVAARAPDGPRVLTSLQCDRVAYAGGRGLCLSRSLTGGPFATPRLTVLDARLRPGASLSLAGYPSRVQMAPDGRLGSVTTFVSGDTYATAGFSTRTEIVQTSPLRVLFGLEQLRVTRDGHTFDNVDFNFWGVTFTADSQHFYATLGSGATTYLIEGDVATREARVLRTGVECPSISPDGTRLAFKSRIPGPTVTWRLEVLDLHTLVAHPLAETRDVDDQAQWLDDSTVIYGLPDVSSANADIATGLTEITAGGSIPTDTWAVAADGSGAPRLLVHAAWSTTVTGRR